MKAFEEHLKNNCPRIRSTSVDAEIMRQTWREALECMLYKSDADCDGGGRGCGVASAIKNELEEE